MKNLIPFRRSFPSNGLTELSTCSAHGRPCHTNHCHQTFSILCHLLSTQLLATSSNALKVTIVAIPLSKSRALYDCFSASPERPFFAAIETMERPPTKMLLKSKSAIYIYIDRYIFAGSPFVDFSATRPTRPKRVRIESYDQALFGCVGPTSL